ncbi:MAG: hypothetical protein ACI87W_001580, partial [Halieaceae bacterium]
MTVCAAVEELSLGPNQRVTDAIASAQGPVVFRGLVADWPLVTKSLDSDSSVMSYLEAAYNDAPVTAFLGDRDIEGRLFYREDIADTNFSRLQTTLTSVLAQIREHATDDHAPTVYMGSTPLDYCFPGMREANDLDLDDHRATVRIWIGNRTRVAPHYDSMENLACVVAGRRRFTVFPPEQIANLYVGPLDLTPAGQAISLVDLNNPDFERFPRFAEALASARTVELDPGDAIYIPSIWWHAVEGLDNFNILVNHWWQEAPEYLGTPADAL